jgi:hypothetical protein
VGAALGVSVGVAEGEPASEPEGDAESDAVGTLVAAPDDVAMIGADGVGDCDAPAPRPASGPRTTTAPKKVTSTNATATAPTVERVASLGAIARSYGDRQAASRPLRRNTLTFGAT